MPSLAILRNQSMTHPHTKLSPRLDQTESRENSAVEAKILQDVVRCVCDRQACIQNISLQFSVMMNYVFSLTASSRFQCVTFLLRHTDDIN